jgi:hypothetical protein
MPDRSELPPHVKELFDSLTAKPEVMYCRHCGTKNLQVETTFFSLGGEFLDRARAGDTRSLVGHLFVAMTWPRCTAHLLGLRFTSALFL